MGLIDVALAPSEKTDQQTEYNNVDTFQSLEILLEARKQACNEMSKLKGIYIIIKDDIVQ